MITRHVYFDRSEVVLIVQGKKKAVTYNLVSSDFNRIQFEKCKELKFGFIPVDSEKITLSSSKLPTVISYTKGQHKKYYEDYKKEFAEYAKKYNITFSDNTKD